MRSSIEEVKRNLNKYLFGNEKVLALPNLPMTEKKLAEVQPKILTAQCDDLKQKIKDELDPSTVKELEKNLKAEETKIQKFMEDYLEDLLHQNLVNTLKE